MKEEITYGLLLDALHCDQLCQIVNRLLEQELPSLYRLPKSDLIALIRTLVKLKDVRIGIKV